MSAVEEKKNTEMKEGGTLSRPASFGMEATVYNQKGGEAGKITLPESVFGLPWNADLVHQVTVSMASSARRGTAHTKTRGEVRGGGKKPWRQKGTGRARHGSTRSPIWVGGGTTHGPRTDKNYDRKVNRKMKTKALFTILSQKNRDGEVFFIDSISFSAPKTKDAVSLLGKFKDVKNFPSASGTHKLFIALSEKDANAVKSFQNIGPISVDEVRNLNPLSLMNHRAILFVNPENALTLLQNKKGVKGEKSEVKKEVSKPKARTKTAKKSPAKKK